MTRGSYRVSGAADLRCEILIIGSGAGGSAAADVLTEAGRDVLMVEEGPAVWSDEAPASAAEGMRALWRANGLTAALGPVPVAYAEGRCLGGGTEINSAIMQRAPDDLVAGWAADYRIGDFGPRQLHPYYERVWREVNASAPPRDAGPPTDLLREAGAKMGWRVTELERAVRQCVGTNMCASACPTGGKQSMTATLLPKALGKGLRLVAQCRIDRLTGSDSRIREARGTATGHDGRHHAVRIRCDHVFVAAGAIHTPALLRRSGIKENIGNSLRLHPTLKLLVEFDHKINAADHLLPLAAVTEFMPQVRLGGSVFVPGFFGMSIAEDWENRRPLLPRMNSCAIYYAMTRAAGRGRIRFLPGLREPLVTYALEPGDIHNLAAGIENLAAAMLAVGAKRVYPSLTRHAGWSKPGEIDAKTVLYRQPKRGQLMTTHLFSSCPMGEDRARCAVDSFGRAHDWQNLTIADASVIPEAPGVNPQATVMALAYRTAEAWQAGQPAAGT